MLINLGFGSHSDCVLTLSVITVKILPVGLISLMLTYMPAVR